MSMAPISMRSIIAIIIAGSGIAVFGILGVIAGLAV